MESFVQRNNKQYFKLFFLDISNIIFNQQSFLQEFNHIMRTKLSWALPPRNNMRASVKLGIESQIKDIIEGRGKENIHVLMNAINNVGREVRGKYKHYSKY
jgi:hypothetical protein